MREDRAQLLSQLQAVQESLRCSFTGGFPENFAGKEADAYRRQLTGAAASLRGIIDRLDREPGVDQPQWRSATIECRSCGAPVHPRERACIWCLTQPAGDEPPSVRAQLFESDDDGM